MIVTGRYPTPQRPRALPQPSAAHGKWLKYAYKSGVRGQRRTKTRNWGHDTASSRSLARITTGWACQISIVPLFQTIAVRTKVPDHGELFSARRWSGKVQRLKSAVVGTSGSVRTNPPAIWFAAWAEPHRPVAPANAPPGKVIFKRFSGVK